MHCSSLIGKGGVQVACYEVFQLFAISFFFITFFGITEIGKDLVIVYSSYDALILGNGTSVMDLHGFVLSGNGIASHLINDIICWDNLFNQFELAFHNPTLDL